jgi:hypothetical protein
MIPPMRTFTNAVCWFGVAACTWLAVMFVVLQRPGFERGAATSSLFILQSLLALAVLNDVVSGRGWRILALAGAAGLIWAGGQAVANTLTGNHFEGFALIIGAALVLQGLLTAKQLITRTFTPSSKVHQFGR